MRKSIKALAVLSLFGLGLGSVTACGGQGSGKSIEISVNGTAVADGGSVTVTEGVPFELEATVEGGDESDIVRWGTNATTAISFDGSTTGNTVTATASKTTTTGWSVFATLESDSTVTTAINVIVSEGTRTYQLSVDTTDAQTEFVQGEAFNSDNLIVNVETLLNGKETGDVVELSEDEYTVSIADGTVLSEQGTEEVTVTANNTDYGSATYTISVGENPAYPVIEALNTIAKNGYLNIFYGTNGLGQQSYVYDKIITNNFYYDSNTSYYYYLKDGQVGRYLQVVDENEQSGIAYVGPAYISMQPATSIADVYNHSNLTSTLFTDWSEEYQTDIAGSTSASGPVATATGEALTFLRNALNYNDRVTLTLSVRDDIMEGMDVLEIVPALDGVSDTTAASYIGVVNDEFNEGLILPFSQIIESEDPTMGYFDLSKNSDGSDYYDTDFSGILSMWCDLDELGGVFAYSSEGALGNMNYYIGNDFIESTLVNEQVSGTMGVIELAQESTSTLENADETITTTYGPGLVAYAAGSNSTPVLGTVDFGNANSVDELGVLWDRIQGISQDYWKYYTFDRVDEISFVGGTTGYGFVFGFSGSDIPMWEVFKGLDPLWADYLDSADDFYNNFFNIPFEPYKIEITFYVIPSAAGMSLGGGNLALYAGDPETHQSQGYLQMYQLANGLNTYVADTVRSSFTPVTSAAQ